MARTNIKMLILGALCFAMGCASTPQPQDSAGRYLLALSEGRASDAWALLSIEAQKKLSKQEYFLRVSAFSKADKQFFKGAIITVNKAAPNASWDFDSGPLRVVKHGETWRIDSTSWPSPKRDSAKAALKAFLVALETHDYNTIHRFIPNAENKVITATMLRDRLGDPGNRSETLQAVKILVKSGTESVHSNGSRSFESGRHRVELKREGATWRITDLE